MKTRLAGLGLIGLGILFAVLFVYLPIRGNGDSVMGGVSTRALVFSPLSIVIGAALLIGGTPVLEAFQARPKTRSQLTLVLSILIGTGVISGLVFWQIQSRYFREPEQVILEVPKMNFPQPR